MKEGSIGTRNCTVNTEKNVVARGEGAAANEEDERVKKERERAALQKRSDR